VAHIRKIRNTFGVSWMWYVAHIRKIRNTFGVSWMWYVAHIRKIRNPYRTKEITQEKNIRSASDFALKKMC
jgi:hypothetical protein